MNKYWSAQIGREELLDVLTSQAGKAQSITIDELRTGLTPDPGRLVAVWRAVEWSKRSPLPQLIVGEEETIEDLLAWSTTYLRGLGPLTAHIRILTPDELKLALQVRPYCDWWQIAGAAAGLVIGEVLTNARRFALPDEVSVAAARSTLSFALMRATALGLATTYFPVLSNSWEALRRRSGQINTIISARVVEEVCRTLVVATSETKSPEPDWTSKQSWFQVVRTREDMSTGLETVSKTGDLTVLANLVTKDKDLTAEERVIRFDDVVSKLVENKNVVDSEKAFGIAVAAFWCHGNLTQQLNFARQFMPNFSEAILWLGAMQVAIPIPESLVVGEGLGWRLAREMSYMDDLFSPPRGDLALAELDVVLHGKSMSRSAKLLDRTRLDVEIFPGISSFVRRTESAIPRQQELPIEHDLPRGYDEFRGVEPLVAAERRWKWPCAFFVMFDIHRKEIRTINTGSANSF